MDVAEMWNELLRRGVSEETLRVVSDINGYSEETMEDILYAVFAENSFED